MPAGTITLTNNSTAVTGSGTAFPTELKANDFLVAVVGGTTYTLGVKSVESATALTLATAYGGPTTSGLAWTPIPNGTLVGITVQIAADTARAIRGLNYDKQNWQQVYSSSGTITVTLPDGSTFTGPSWNGVATALTGKADKNDPRLNTINGKSGGDVSGNVAIEGALAIRGPDPAGGWPAFINFQAGQGNNVTYTRLYQERSGDMTLVTNMAATAKYFQFNSQGNFVSPGNITCVSLTQTSDRDKKDKITNIENALDKIDAIRGVTYELKASGLPSAGVIAQELIEVLPEAVGSAFDDHDEYQEVEEEVQNEVVGEYGEKTFITETIKVNKLLRKRDESKRSYTVEYAGVVALCVQAIKELRQEVETLKNLHNA